MTLAIKLQDLLLQDSDALAAASNLLLQQVAVLDCQGIDFLSSNQLDLLFGNIPENWDFLALNELIESNSLSDSLATQLDEWMSQRMPLVDMDPDLSSTITATGIDHILSFLPVFEHRSSKLYHIDPQQNPLQPCTYSNEVDGFLQALHDEGVILLSFNWGVWLDEANEYVNDPELLDYANLLTLQKILTTHVRAERFNSGNLAQLIENGHILAVLKRLALLREEMVEGSLPTSTHAIARLTATRGDLTQQAVDAIVNSTNVALDIQGATGEAIHAIAGPGLKDECRKLKGCAVGQAKITKGYNLPADWVIHTVAPIWQGGDHGEEDDLVQCYHNSLALAALCPIQTIAFPAIGIGSHSFPVDRAAHLAVTAVHEFLTTNTSIEKVIFVCCNAGVFDAYSRAIKELY